MRSGNYLLFNWLWQQLINIKIMMQNTSLTMNYPSSLPISNKSQCVLIFCRCFSSAVFGGILFWLGIGRFLPVSEKDNQFDFHVSFCT